MSGSQSGFVCWEGPAYTLTGAGQVPGQGGVSCLAHFSSSPLLSVHLHPWGPEGEPYPCPGGSPSLSFPSPPHPPAAALPHPASALDPGHGHCLEIKGEASGWGRKIRVLAEEEASAGNQTQ